MENFWGIPLTLFYVVLLCILIRKWSFFSTENFSKKSLYFFFLYKVFLGTILTLIYTYYYTDRQLADIYKYFDDSYHMTRALWEEPVDFFKMLFGIGNDSAYYTEKYYSHMNHWFRQYETQVYNDNHTIIRFNACVRLLSFGYFHVHTVVVAFLSFQGLFAFYKGFKLFLQTEKHVWLGALLFLFPSLNFWSSGVLKEGLLIFALGNIFYLALLLLNKSNFKMHFALLLFFLFVAMHLKSYALAAMLVSLGLIYCHHFFSRLSLAALYASALVALILAVVVFEKAFPEFDVPGLIAQKHDDFIRLSEAMKAGSSFDIGDFDGNWASILALTPMAWLTGLFRPFIWESGGIFGLLSAMESIFILGLFIASTLYFKKGEKKDTNAFISFFITLSIIAVLIGIASGNFGSLVRYRVPLLPFLIYCSVAFLDKEKLMQLVKKKS